MTAITLIPAAVMWLAALLRLPAAVRQPRSRPFTLAVVLFAAAATLRIPEVAAVVQRLSGSSGAASIVLTDILAVLGAATFRKIVVNATQAATPNAPGVRKRRHYFAGGTIVALAVVDVFVPVQHVYGPEHAGPLTFNQTIWLVTYCATFLPAIALSLLGVTASSWTAARSDSRRTNAGAFLLLGAGCSVGLLWVLAQYAMLVLNRLGLDASLPRALFKPFIVVALALVALSAIAPVPDLLATRWRRQWSPRARARSAALRRLWRALIVATPSIRLDQPGDDSTGIRPTSSYRLLIEVRDGILAVRPYITQAMRDAAEQACDRVGPRERCRLFSAAIQLELARASKLRGDPPGLDTPLESGQGSNIPDDAAALGTFARTWEDPITQRLLAEANASLATGVQ